MDNKYERTFTEKAYFVFLSSFIFLIGTRTQQLINNQTFFETETE